MDEFELGDLVILEDDDGEEYEAIVKEDDDGGLYFEPINRNYRPEDE